VSLDIGLNVSALIELLLGDTGTVLSSVGT